MNLATVFKQIVHSKSTQQTPSLNLIETYTQCILLLSKTPIYEAKLSFQERKTWDKVQTILSKEVKIRNKNVLLKDWLEIYDVFRMTVEDLISDGFVSICEDDLVELELRLDKVLIKLFERAVYELQYPKKDEKTMLVPAIKPIKLPEVDVDMSSDDVAASLEEESAESGDSTLTSQGSSSRRSSLLSD